MRENSCLTGPGTNKIERKSGALPISDIQKGLRLKISLKNKASKHTVTTFLTGNLDSRGWLKAKDYHSSLPLRSVSYESQKEQTAHMQSSVIYTTARLPLIWRTPMFKIAQNGKLWSAMEQKDQVTSLR